MGNEGCTETDAISLGREVKRCQTVNSARWKNASATQRAGKGNHTSYLMGLFYLLCVVGRVGQHSGHMKHNLIVLVTRVEGVCPRGVRYKKHKKHKNTHVTQKDLTKSINVSEWKTKLKLSQSGWNVSHLLFSAAHWRENSLQIISSDYAISQALLRLHVAR